MARLGMVIDLQRCVGCGACALACKTENNTRDRTETQTFNWADFAFLTEGDYPDVRFTVLPVLCNHCSNAACVRVCPARPKAMYKTESGITMHNDERCIGCQRCQHACPYSSLEISESDTGTSVISFHDPTEDVEPRFADSESFIPGCTASGAEIARITEQAPPYRTRYRHPDYGSVRRPGITEKCIFCAHRVEKGEAPWCVEACPARARVFGDLDDPGSAPSVLLGKHAAFRLKEDKGTQPNVHYIRSFATRRGR